MAATLTDAEAALIDASKAGLLDEVASLIDAGTAVNAVNGLGMSSLHYASGRGHAAVVDLLIARGANVNAPGKRGATPLCQAAATGHTDTVRALLAAGADVTAHDQDRGTALHEAAYYGHAEVLQLLLGSPLGGQVDATSPDGETALHWAVMNGHLEVARALVAHGATPGLRNTEGVTLLHFAANADADDDALVRQVLVWDPSLLNAVNCVGRSPLHEAVIKGEVAPIRALLEAGADRALLDEDEKSALQLAEDEQVEEVLALLRQL